MNAAHRAATPEERAHVTTKNFVRDLFTALELEADIEPDELEEEIEKTTTIVVARIAARLTERFPNIFS